MVDEAMPFIERKVETDCACYRTRKGRVKLCFWHAWQEWKIRESARRKYVRPA